ncbi:MAG: TIGR02996 domain-containing protein, partial [Deltaproteobacteria bacterium]|nr:TIGR02996 domain-containing protein [Deltaproteobacteria bacterium]
RGTGHFGLRMFAALEAMLGRELPRWRRYRSDFRVMVGDVEGGIADLEWDLATLPRNDGDRPYVVRAIAKLADARILADIVTNPEDDAPRLVLADMLTERGDPRGEMIVALCRSSKLDDDDPERESLLVRVNQLLAVHGRTWGKKGYAYWRGFVHGVVVRWPTYAEQLDEAFALSPPIQELRFQAYKNERMKDPTRALDDPRLDKITELEFSSPRFEVDGEVIRFEREVVRRLAGRFPNLRKLAIRDAELTIDEVRSIGPRPKLETLDLGHISLRGGLPAIFGATRFDALRELKLDHCGIDDDDVAALATLPALTKLEVGNNAIGARGALALARLPLRYLQVEDNAIGDEGASALAACFKGVRLHVAGAGIGNPGVSALADLELSSLDLGRNAYDASAARAIARGRVAKTLRKLVLGPCGDQKLSGEIVHALAGMPRLWMLLLRGCAIDADGAVALLDGIPQLRVLTLGHCAIDDAGLAKIVAHPAFAQIDTLELDHNALGPDAGAILARCPQLPRTLYLNNNHLGDAGARALAEAPVASRVVELLLVNNGITEEGARALVGESSQLVGAISRLCLHENEIGEAAAALCNEKLGPRFCYPGSARTG